MRILNRITLVYSNLGLIFLALPIILISNNDTVLQLVTEI